MTTCHIQWLLFKEEVKEMPTKTFFNLPKQKQEVIIEAAKKEFSRVTFDKASINQIIKDAAISRGSFYMYFSDKMDLLDYLMTFYKETITYFLKETVIAEKGNLHQIILKTHDFFFLIRNDVDNQKFVKNIITHFYLNSTMTSSDCNKAMPFDNQFRKLVPFLDPNQFAFQDPNKINDVVEVTFFIMQSAIYQSMIHGEDIEASRERLLRQMNILQQGYSRKEG